MNLEKRQNQKNVAIFTYIKLTTDIKTVFLCMLRNIPFILSIVINYSSVGQYKVILGNIIIYLKLMRLIKMIGKYFRAKIQAIHGSTLRASDRETSVQ